VLTRPFRLLVDLAAPAPAAKVEVGPPAGLRDQLLAMNQALDAGRFLPPGRLEGVQELLNSTSDLPGESEADRRATAARIDTLKNQLGLSLSAGWLYNTRLGIPDLEEGPYRWRTYLGLNWDFLDNGMLKRSGERRLQRQNLLADSLAGWQRQREENYYFHRDRVIHLYLPGKIRLLELKKSFLLSWLDFSRRRVWGGAAPLEELIEAERDLAATENDLANAQTYRRQMETHVRLPATDRKSVV
jgi:hypothetical protein